VKGFPGVLEVTLKVEFLLGQTSVGPEIGPRIGIATTFTILMADVLQKTPAGVGVAVIK
jgi:hypothetical protein